MMKRGQSSMQILMKTLFRKMCEEKLKNKQRNVMMKGEISWNEFDFNPEIAALRS